MNQRRRIYQTALGIQTGDIVSTSYGTGPYEVWHIRIRTPVLIVQ